MTFTDIYLSGFQQGQSKMAGIGGVPPALPGVKKLDGKMPKMKETPKIRKAWAPNRSQAKKASYTDIYLNGLHQGMTKQALSLKDIKNFRPFAKGNEGITGSALGAAGGALTLGLGNALFGSRKRDEEGRPHSGFLSRGLKGMALGGLLGGVGGYLGRNQIRDFGFGKTKDQIERGLPGKGWIPDSVEGMAGDIGAENATLGDFGNYITGGEEGVVKGRTDGLVDGVTQKITNFFQ